MAAGEGQWRAEEARDASATACDTSVAFATACDTSVAAGCSAAEARDAGEWLPLGSCCWGWRQQSAGYASSGAEVSMFCRSRTEV